MKLCQRVCLDEQGRISNSLWVLGLKMPEQDPGFVRLCSPCELSFHPFILEAYGFYSKLWASSLPSSLKLSWSIGLHDDDQHKALLSGLSSNRSLLLLSETLLGMREASEGVGLGLYGIVPKPEQNLLVLHLANTQNISVGTLVGALLILKTAVDSLLFVRGLKIEKSILESCEPDPIDAELKKLFALLST